MKIIIAGTGNTLYFLGRIFTSKGHDVVLINRNRSECTEFARKLNATIICGDGSDITILQEAGAMGADAVLAVTPNDQDNLVICQLASLQYEVPRTIAMANDPDNTEIFEKLGVSAFSTTQIIGKLVEERASLEQITNLLPVAEGRVMITEVVLDTNSPVAGKLLKNIVMPQNSLVAVVIRNNQPIIPRGENNLLPGDRVVLITLSENHGIVLRLFTGEH